MKAHRICLTLSLLAAATGAAAQATIDHDKAMAGNVTPGDAPGYPVTISVPGHYVLKGNLQVPFNAGGIFITASGVTLDLNGFSVSGPGNCVYGVTQMSCTLPGILDNGERLEKSGIRVSSSAKGVTVRNGSVRGFRGNGVVGSSLLLQDLAVLHNRHVGLDVGGAHAPSIVSTTRVGFNGGHGIQASNVIVDRSAITMNGGHGMWGNRAQVLQSRLANNVQRGIVSHGSGNHSLIRDSDLRDNGQGATSGNVLSQGGNYNGGAALF